MLINSGHPTPWGSLDYIGTATISAASSGPNTIITGPAGYFILVLGYLLVASGDVEVAFETESGAVISGPYDIAQNGGNISTPVGMGQFACKQDEDLILDLGGAIHVGGHIVYGLIKGGV